MVGFGTKLLRIRRNNSLSGEEMAEKLRPFLTKMKVSKQHVSNWEKRILPPGQDVIDAYSKAFNIEEADLRGLNNPENHTRVSESETLHSKPQQETGRRIPIYDTIAVAGFSMEAEQTPTSEPTEMINPGSWFKGATAAMRVTGDSMFPKYRAGCVVALRQIFDLQNEILWGEDYVVEMQENRVLKVVQQSEKGEEFIDLLSINPQIDNKGKAKNPPKTYPLAKVRRLFKVIGKFDYETGAGGGFIMNGGTKEYLP